MRGRPQKLADFGRRLGGFVSVCPRYDGERNRQSGLLFSIRLRAWGNCDAGCRVAWKASALAAAEVADAWRIVPRALVVAYGWCLWQVTSWFMALPDPGAPQSAFVSIVWGAMATLTGWYLSTGRKWQST